MIICPYPKGTVGSQRFRFELFLKELPGWGISYSQKPFWSESAFKILYQRGNAPSKLAYFISGLIKRYLLLFQLGKYDALLIHREAIPIGPPVWEWIALVLFGKPAIYDFDDAIWLEKTSETNKKVSWLKWARKVPFIIKNSRYISAGNQFLKKYAESFNDNALFIPTVVETNEHRSERNQNSEKITVGWTGTHSTLPYLDPVLMIIRKLKSDLEFDFLIIADQDPDYQDLEYEFVLFSHSREIKDLDRIDIGIMPVPDDDWAKGKCGFKLIQYMALEKASLASPVGVNSILIGENERGMYASKPQDWEQGLKELIKNSDLRKEYGKRGRDFVENQFSRNSLLPNYRKLLLSVFEPLE